METENICISCSRNDRKCAQHDVTHCPERDEREKKAEDGSAVLEYAGAVVTAYIKGANLVFKRGLKRRAVPLAQILENITESRPDGVTSADWVDLATLESKIMIYCKDKMPQNVRGPLQQIVRHMRNDRREDRGLPPVGWHKKEEKKSNKKGVKR